MLPVCSNFLQWMESCLNWDWMFPHPTKMEYANIDHKTSKTLKICELFDNVYLVKTNLSLIRCYLWLYQIIRNSMGKSRFVRLYWSISHFATVILSNCCNGWYLEKISTITKYKSQKVNLFLLYISSRWVKFYKMRYREHVASEAR